MRVRNIVTSVNSATSTAEVLLAFVLSCPSGRSPRGPRFRGPVTSTYPRPHRSCSRALGASRAPASFAPSSHQVLAPIPPSPPRLHGGRSAPPASPPRATQHQQHRLYCSPSGLDSARGPAVRAAGRFRQGTAAHQGLSARGFRSYRTFGCRNTSVFPQHPQLSGRGPR
jgi:hypothetical protein